MNADSPLRARNSQTTRTPAPPCSLMLQCAATSTWRSHTTPSGVWTKAASAAGAGVAGRAFQ